MSDPKVNEIFDAAHRAHACPEITDVCNQLIANGVDSRAVFGTLCAMVCDGALQLHMNETDLLKFMSTVFKVVLETDRAPS